MTRLALFTAALAATAATGCLSTDALSLRISDAPGTLDEAASWSISDGAIGVYPAGTLTFPQHRAIKLELIREADGAESRESVAFGAFEVVPGSSCRLVRAARCTGTSCGAELEITQTGTCMVRVRSATPDGEELEHCWYVAAFEQDPADPQSIERRGEMIEAERQACSDAL